MPETSTHVYRVILTPRTFQMTSDDWHILVVCPNGLELWDSSPWKWTAKIKARRMIRRHQRGGYQDNRKTEEFEISLSATDEN